MRKTPSMTTYSPGEVLLAVIAFSGGLGRKQRPVIVVSKDDFNRAGTKLIVATITGTIAPPFRVGEVLISEWKKSGLVKPSAMRGALVTIDKRDILRSMGQLAESDFANVEAAIAQIFGFSPN